jgi:uncharacterized protein (DUF1697 family)
MSDINSARYLALLRGINVGGKNIIKMADLRACFEAMGFTGVRTYIQSGNVLFSSDELDLSGLTGNIEKRLSAEFDYKSKVVLVSREHLASVVENAPADFGSDPAAYRYDVLFLKEPLTPAEAMNSISTRDGVDSVWKGDNVLYFARLISRAGQSYLNKIITLPVYKSMTIRNWNTTTRLHDMMKGGV